jgi:hypothetical protein
MRGVIARTSACPHSTADAANDGSVAWRLAFSIAAGS